MAVGSVVVVWEREIWKMRFMEKNHRSDAFVGHASLFNLTKAVLLHGM
jgi:hypothetical protein